MMPVQQICLNEKIYFTSDGIISLLEENNDLKNALSEQQLYIEELIHEKTSEMDDSNCHCCHCTCGA
jgi:hypothetical protein